MLAYACLVNILPESCLENRKFCCDSRGGVTITQGKVSKADIYLLDKKRERERKGLSFLWDTVYSIKRAAFNLAEGWVLSKRN